MNDKSPLSDLKQLARRAGTKPLAALVFGLDAVLGADVGDGADALAIDGGRIVGVGKKDVLAAQFPALPSLDGRGYAALPGLVNAHVHCPMGFFRGLGHGIESMIETFLFPAEKALTPDMTAPLSYSYLVSGLQSGVTCFGEHYYFADGVAQALDRLGLRGVVGETVADLGGAFPGAASLARAKKQLEGWAFSSRVKPAVAPHAADTVSKPLMAELAAMARTHGAPLHLHLSQSAGERARVLAREGVSPVRFAEDAKALGPNTLAVHLVSADEDDVRRLAAHGATAGYCPASQIIYETLAPIALFQKHGVPMALGTDCAASNDGADLIGEMKLAMLLAMDRGLPPASRSAEAAFAMATANGAKAFGLDREIGSLAAGKAADVVFVENSLALLPMPRPLHNFVFSASPRQVRHVLVDGRLVLFDGEPYQVTAADLAAEYVAAVTEIKGRIGMA